MAKKVAKKSSRRKQTRIEGTFDKVPAPVQKAADEFVEAKRQTAEWRAHMNGRKETLIAVMREHNVLEIEIDDG